VNLDDDGWGTVLDLVTVLCGIGVGVMCWDELWIAYRSMVGCVGCVLCDTVIDCVPAWRPNQL
jgi:hypothetical protein